MTLLHYAAKAGARGVGDPDEACRMVCNTLASLSSGQEWDGDGGQGGMTLLHYAAKAGARGVGDPDEACRMVCNISVALW